MSFKLLSPSELYLQLHQHLLCYVEPLLDEASLSIRGFTKAKTFLEIDRKAPLDAVLRQLDFVTSNHHELLHVCNEETKKIMISIYQFLDSIEDAVEELENTSQVCYIIVDDAFVRPENVCMEKLESKYAPYLYQLPLELKKFQALFSRLGMKSSFTAVNISSALDAMKVTHGDTVLENSAYARASQLVLKMPLLWQVRPYIMKAPQSLASFSALLTHLGAAEESSVELYASLLKKLYVQYTGRKLTPDDLAASHEAVRCLVAHVLRTEETSSLKEMYLPSLKGCLHPSSNLVYNDHSAFAERLGSSSFDEPFLVDPKLCRVERADFDEAMRRIPQELRPRSLFNIIEENVHEPFADNGFQASSARSEPLQMLLQSELFLDGLWRLIWHENIDREHKPSEKIRRTLEKALQSIEVRRSQQLVTYLSHNGRRMEGSERKADGFISRVATGTEQERYIIYTAAGPISMMTNIQVAEIIHRISDGLLRNSLLYLYPMLQCEPSNIEQLLDKLRITTRGSGRGLPLHQTPE